MSLNEFHRINILRQHEAFAPPHNLTALVVCVQEEVGELAAAVLGVTGEKKRKAHLTNADVLDAVADAMTYLSLVAGAVGCTDLEKLIGDTFNMVSERAGSAYRTTLGRADGERMMEGYKSLATVLNNRDVDGIRRAAKFIERVEPHPPLTDIQAHHAIEKIEGQLDQVGMDDARAALAKIIAELDRHAERVRKSFEDHPF